PPPASPASPARLTASSIRPRNASARTVTFPLGRSYPSSPFMLSLRSVTKRYGSLTALDDVSLEIAAGEFFGLLGPNGAGKSTLMSLAAGLRTPDTGTVLIDGQSVSSQAPAARRALGLVPQSLALFPQLTAEENLRIFGELQGL